VLQGVQQQHAYAARCKLAHLDSASFVAHYVHTSIVHCYFPPATQAVLSAAAPLPLHPEQALLHSRLGNHPAALALLALAPPRLVEGAIAYCRALDSQEAWLALLELFLNPPGVLGAAGSEGGFAGGLEPSVLAAVGTQLEPDYASACRVLNAEGASLNPLRLLAALPADMPLHLAGELLGQVLSGLQHRRRHGQVVR
jgi:hypothetical protein